MSEPTGNDIFTASARWRASLGKYIDPGDMRSAPARTFAGDAHPYVSAALKGVCEHLAGLTESSGRNTYLNDQLWRFTGYAAAGHIGEADVHAELRDAARASGLGDLEVRKVFRGDTTGAIANGRATPLDPRPMSEADLARYGKTPAADHASLVWTPPATSLDPATGEVLPSPLVGAQPPAATAPGAAGSATTEVEPSEDELERRRFEYAIAAELRTQRIRLEAKQRLEDERHAASFRVPQQQPTLAEYLELPVPETTWAVEQLIPARGNVLLAAAFKAGKTTLVSNLAASFADGEPFLARFAAHADEGGRVALWNYEVDAAQYIGWLRELDIVNPSRVALLNLRGHTVPITVPRVADWCVEWLKRHEVRWWVVDPFARAFTGKNENDNTEVARWLDALDEVKHRAGVEVLMLPTHTGRAEFEPGAERARGATRLDDWADVRWLLTRDEGGNRFLRATGRDVEVAEEQLTFEPTTRRLLFGGHDRVGVKRRALEDAVADIVVANPGIGVRDLRQKMREAGHSGRNERLDASIAAASRYRRISVEDRGTQGVRHYPIGHLPGAFTPPVLDPSGGSR